MHTGAVTRGIGAARGPGRAPSAAAWLAGVRKHPLVVILAAIAAAGTVVGIVFGVLSGVARAAWEDTDSYRTEYVALAPLRVGVPPEYVESLLGDPDSVGGLCAVTSCPAETEAPAAAALGTYAPTAPATLHVYLGDHSIVRAVFQGRRLAGYLVTTTSRDFAPAITWLGVDLGRLGRVTFADVLPSNGAPEPSDASVRIGRRMPSYAEVLMGGGASRYEGFLLGSAPVGYTGPGLEWDVEAAREFESWQTGNPDRGLDSDVARPFREGSMPNTFGAFRDEGPLGAYFRDAENVRALLDSAVEF